MPTRFDWRLGPGEDIAAELASELSSGKRAQPRTSNVVKQLPLFASLLALAAVFGFLLGRWTESRRFIVHGVENQIALEQLAWREGDRELFESTLDPWSTAKWRSEQIFEFITTAPVRWEGRVDEIINLPDDHRLQAIVEVKTPGTEAETVVRLYVLRGERWLRTEP